MTFKKEMFSERFLWPFNKNRISLAIERKKAEKSKLYDLTVSNPLLCGFEYDERLIKKAFQKVSWLEYSPHPLGRFDARKAVRKYYEDRNIFVNFNNICLTCSTSEAYSFIFKLLCNPYDEILVPSPSYPLFQHLSELDNVSITPYRIKYDGNKFKVDFDSFFGSISQKTKAIIIVNPNNPTGSYIKPDEIENIIRICTDNNIAIISDEVFLDYSEGRKYNLSLASNDKCLTFVLSGLSKVCGLPNLKLSWICINGSGKQCIETMDRLEFISDSYLSVSTIVQQALPLILSGSDNIQKQIKDRLRDNENFLYDSLQSVPSLRLLLREGGWYAIIETPDFADDEAFIVSLIEDNNVLVYPGYFFDFKRFGYFVLSLIVKPEDFKEGVSRLIGRSEFLV
ncbi:MAG: pyridoxal phosphate-dependent aminotransferase [Desulfobacterales bacterium]|nr:pyridoxal phosphate-dependent aminotransferase [Desulfobacterales bacterium]